MTNIKNELFPGEEEKTTQAMREYEFLVNFALTH